MAASYMLSLGQHRAAAVRACYGRFRDLVPSNLAVGPPRNLSGTNESLQTLLDAMKKQGATNYLVVIHGYDDGSGFYLPLTAGNAHHSRFGKIKTILKIQERVIKPEKVRSGMKDGEVPKAVQAMVQKSQGSELGQIGMNAATLGKFLTLVLEVQRSKVGWFEFRGCNLGKNAESMNAFRRLFGARHLGAPKLHTFYGQFDARTGTRWIDTHGQHHQGTTHTFTKQFKNPSGVCHCCIGVRSNQKPQNGHIIADSSRSVKRWVQATHQVGDGGSLDRIPIYGLWETNATHKTTDPNDPLAGQVTGKPGPIWPRSRWYRQNIRYSHG